MITMLRKRFALSEQGAKDMVWGCIACILQNLSFLLPVGLLYMLVKDMLEQTLSEHKMLYVIGCVVGLFLMLVTSWLQYNGTYLATYVETGVRRISIAEKLRKIPLSYFGKKDLADLTSTIMNDCAVLEQSHSHFVCPLVGAVFSTIITAISLFFFDYRMAIAALWVLPIAFGIVLASSRVQKMFSNASSKAKVECEEGIQECIEAMKDLRSNNAEGVVLESLEEKIRLVEKRAIISEFGMAAFVGTAELVLKLGIATTALVGAALLTKGDIDVLTFFLFMLVVSRIYDPLEGALQNLGAIITTTTNIERMNEILEHSVQGGSNQLTNQGYDICFEHVNFAYDNGETVLGDVSFTAKQGEVTALVGPSGGGKTTVSRLAARFWDINKGKITVGGMDVSEIEPETLMSLYSVVFQDVTLFNNTIMENIRIGKSDATDEEVVAAAKLANVDEFALKLPNQWNTLIGENGCELSGGERQRISIARAFLKNAPIILLDEATASLDVENETLIQAALSRLIQDKTVLIIAHRMRTVAGADKIVVLSEGVVAEQGAPEELYKKNGSYTHMSNLQSSSQTWAIE